MGGAGSQVLMISAPRDVHARTVGRHLVEAGARPALFDIRDFPSRARLVMRRGSEPSTSLLLPDGTVVGAPDLVSVWWRRPQRPRIAAEIADSDHRQFALNEAYCALNGLWHSLDARWVNPVLADSAASHKPYQLQIAPQAGLSVPATIITNSVAAAHDFIDAHDGQVIYKALGGLPNAWRETRLLRDGERALLDAVRHAPVIFQEMVDGTDLRVTLVGEDLFAAEMDTTQARYPYDIRMDMTVPVKEAKLDAPTESGLRRLMAILGLEYGAVDLKRRSDGRFIFLEINPAGQFLHIEELTGMPIASAVAARLLRPKETANGEDEGPFPKKATVGPAPGTPSEDRTAGERAGGVARRRSVRARRRSASSTP